MTPLKITNLVGIIFLVVLSAAFCVIYFEVDTRGDFKWAFYPDSWIKRSLFEITPPGTSLDACVRLIHSNIKYDPEQPPTVENHGAHPSGWNAKETGKKSVAVGLLYWKYKHDPVFETIWASYAFDENGRLIAIIIERTRTGP